MRSSLCYNFLSLLVQDRHVDMSFRPRRSEPWRSCGYDLNFGVHASAYGLFKNDISSSRFYESILGVHALTFIEIKLKIDMLTCRSVQVNFDVVCKVW